MNADKQINKLYQLKYRVGFGKANGAFGELLQGILPDKKQFMVTFPVNLFSHVTFSPKNDLNITSFPKHKIKSITLAKNIINYFGAKVGGELIINSEIPEGKGLASSSADLVATAYAVADALGVTLSKELIAQLIREIEPSDGVMYQSIVSFYYQELKLIKNIGNIDSLVIVAVDEGYVIDTLEYNSKVKFYTSSCALKYQQLLTQLTVAIKKNDLSTIGKIATESALMNQLNNPKKLLPDIIEICEEIKGLGVVVAHSGSFVGILLNPKIDDFTAQKITCYRRLEKLNANLQVFSSINFETNALPQELSSTIQEELSICC